jgi:hypothetical protein
MARFYPMRGNKMLCIRAMKKPEEEILPRPGKNIV